MFAETKIIKQRTIAILFGIACMMLEDGNPLSENICVNKVADPLGVRVLLSFSKST